MTAQTLSSRLREIYDSYRHSLPREELLQAVDQTVHLSESGRLMGHRLVQAALFRHAGIRAPREQVLEALREHDPAGLAARQERILPRRTYDVTEAMILWHIDCDLHILAVGASALSCCWRLRPPGDRFLTWHCSVPNAFLKTANAQPQQLLLVPCQVT